MLCVQSSMPASPAVSPSTSPTPISNSAIFAFGSHTHLPPCPVFSFPHKDRTHTSIKPFSFSSTTQCRTIRDDNPLKRRRRLADVDGEWTAANLRKKRRLRLTLITSRLSHPFSYPATNIIGHGESRAVVWSRLCKARASRIAANARGLPATRAHPVGGAGTSGPEPLLRKAAILQCIRLRNKTQLDAREQALSDALTVPLTRQLRSQDLEPTDIVADEPFVEPDETIEAAPHISPNLVTSRLPYAPVAPSPLRTNYDALEEEDRYSDDEDGDSEGAYSSDWSVRDDEEGDGEAFSSIASGWHGFE